MVLAPTRPRVHPQPIRITGFGVAISVNLLVFFLLSLPGEPTELVQPAEPPTRIQVEEIQPVEIVPITLPPAMPIAPDRPQTVTPTPLPIRSIAEATPMSTAAEPVAVTRSELAVNTYQVSAPPPTTQVSYILTPPPRYPAQLVRRGVEGVVLLRVLVGSTGLPQQVDIAEGSGNALLDRAARDQVLQRWRFQPAVRRGQAVAAWVEIPIEFTIPR